MYDVIIIGTGPAGLTASIYCCCFKLEHLTIGAVAGGQMILAPDILNYPGFSEISGTLLTDNMVNQLKVRGGTLVTDSVVKIEKEDAGFVVTTASEKQYETKSIILATGVERKKLQVKGENEYSGKGIQYCAKCDRFDYEGKITAVAGGANAAAQTAMQLSHAAKKVYIVCRGADLRADPVWLSQMKLADNIEIIPNTQITEIIGDNSKMTAIKLLSGTETKILDIEKLYIEIGGVPGTSLLIPLGMKLDPGGYISVDHTLATSIPGIFAAGDVISHQYSIEQIASAVGTGATAAMSVFSYLKSEKAPSLWGTSQIKRPDIKK